MNFSCFFVFIIFIFTLVVVKCSAEATTETTFNENDQMTTVKEITTDNSSFTIEATSVTGVTDEGATGMPEATTIKRLDPLNEALLKFDLNLKINCTDRNCTELLCSNSSDFINLQQSLNDFMCSNKFSTIECELQIYTKNCLKRSTIFQGDLIYELKFKPRNKIDLDDIKVLFKNYTFELKYNSSLWNDEFKKIQLNDNIEIDFGTGFSSFDASYQKLEKTDSCKILSCLNEYFTPVCAKDQPLMCKHKCDVGEYCKNKGECVKSLFYEPKCLCNYAKIHNWGINIHYKGTYCEISHHTISRSLFILIVTMISSVLVLLIILAALKFHVLKKKTGKVTIIRA